jgi:signal transduction histidine kinase
VLLTFAPGHRLRAVVGLTAACVVLGVWTGVRATAQGPAPPATPAAHATADTRPLVVLLHSYDTNYDWSRHITSGLYAGMARLGVVADVREEYLDVRRHERREHFPLVRALLRTKYGAPAPRLVVASDNAAVEFLLAYPDVFAGVPVVVGGIDDETLLARLPRDRFTGLGEQFLLESLIDLGTRLRPGVQRIFTITDNTPYGRGHQGLFAYIQSMRPNVRLVDLSASRHTVAQIRDRLIAETTPDDLVLVASITHDLTDAHQTAGQVVRMVAAASRAPVIGFGFSDVGQGVLATTASTGHQHGQLLARRVQQVLAGTPVRDIPLAMDSATVLAFDAPQLSRWGIPREALPSNALVLNEPPSFYRAYRRMIWAGAAFIGLQMLIIGGLIVNVRRRRRAESVLAAQASALASSNHQLEEMNRSLRLETQGRVQAEDHLRHAQKMEAVGRLAGGVAHDFNNLLTVILGYASLLHGAARDTTAREGLEQIRRAGEQAASLTQNLLAFSRKSVAAPVRVDVAVAIGQLEPMVRRFCGDDVTLTLDLDPATGQVALGEGQLEQVLLNLVINARDAMPAGGDLRITCRGDEVTAVPDAPELRAGRHIVIRVADTGVGMDEETRAHVFEPFFTTKPVGRGTGLGLATVYGIVTQHGGAVTVTSAPGAGSCFSVWLPEATVVATGDPSPVAAATVGRGEVILLVEDEVDLRRLAATVLREAGYEVIEAPNGSAALALVQHRDAALHLVLTDVVMPGMDGYLLAQRLRECCPEVRIAFMSGYAEPEIEARATTDPSLLLRKPFTPTTLLAHVRHALSSEAGTRPRLAAG